MDTTAAEVGHHPRGRRGRRRLLVGIAIAFACYLILTMANPRSVPRLAILPEPASRGAWWDECDGRPGNRHEEGWERGDLFWTRWEFRTLAGCPSDFE